MVRELKKGIESGTVLFGVRQALRHSKTVQKAVVPSDCRQEVVSLLTKQNIDVELLETSKEETANKLEIPFHCEVFALKQ